MSAWAVDNSHSIVSFKIRHMMISKVRGEFTSWNAELGFDPDDLTKASVNVEIDVASINTLNADRDKHLCSPDFFDAETYPKITFKTTDVTSKGDKVKVTGDLTIRDQTRPVTLDLTREGSGKDPWGNIRVGFSGGTTINRKDFGLTWSQALETGGVLVGDKVEIELEVQVFKPA